MINKLVTDNERHCLSTTKMGLFDWGMGGGGRGNVWHKTFKNNFMAQSIKVFLPAVVYTSID